MSEYIRKADAIDILDDFQVGIENGEGNYSWAKFKMNELEPADVLPYSIDSDGTLTVTVPKGTEVGRVLVQEEGTQWGGLYYAD